MNHTISSDQLPPTPTRPRASQNAYNRAEALLAGASRRHEIMGQAMLQAESATQQQPAVWLGQPGADVFTQVSTAAQQQILAAQAELANAEQLANQMMAADPELIAYQTQAYGTPVPLPTPVTSWGQGSPVFNTEGEIIGMTPHGSAAQPQPTATIQPLAPNQASD